MSARQLVDPNAPIIIVKSIFAKYDKNADQKINPAELMELAYDLGYYMTKEHSTSLLKTLDTDGDDHISFDEFLNWWKQHDKFKLMENPSKLKKIHEAVKAFRKLDVNNDGSIDVHEWHIFWAAFVSDGKSFTPEEEKKSLAIYKLVDKDGDGLVQWNEFHDLLEKHGLVQ
eukprot:TRINITY_DN3293_c0_g1_i1.p1 TRINITY_DN3293_c0_g1~~TRINITY_DN3293_c0_g1_i1.p1  ORF type:complete len:171 (-),score=30.64 TRINITY_DN3293_c0_g1_i1:24-536(-)